MGEACRLSAHVIPDVLPGLSDPVEHTMSLVMMPPTVASITQQFDKFLARALGNRSQSFR
jgi:hypothetical protein